MGRREKQANAATDDNLITCIDKNVFLWKMYTG